MEFEFAKLGEDLMTSLLEPDAGKRRTAIQTWKDSAIPVLQAELPKEIDKYLEWVTDGTWTEEGWNARQPKWRRTVFHLVMDIKLAQRGIREIPVAEVKAPLEPSNDQGNQSSSKGNTNEAVYDDDNDYEGEQGRSPNDDRSDSMNPNSSASQATQDNRSDQLNPNNSAYWSSRGR